MRRLRRASRLAAVLPASVALLSGCASELHREKVDLRQGVPVAAILALSGSAEVYGRAQRTGIELARERINEDGGINGLPLHVRLEDSGSDDAGANAAFTEEIDAGVLALIGPTLSQQAFSAAPIAQRRSVPMVAPSNTATGIPRIGDFISRVAVESAGIAPLSIDQAFRQNPELRRVTVFYAPDDAYSVAETTIFQKALTERDIAPITVQRLALNEPDLRSQITDTLAGRPDLIVLSLHAAQGARLVRRLREAGYEGMIVAGNGMNTPKIFPICQRFCDGVLIAQAYSPELSTPVNRAFVRSFRTLSGPDALPSEGTAQAYAALQVVAEALQRLDRRLPLKGATLVEARRELMGEILSGTYQTPLGEIRFTADGEVVQKQRFVARVRMDPQGKGGRFTLLE